MKKWIVLGLVVLLHASLAYFSFAVQFGIAHMCPSDRPKVVERVWGGVMLVTWQPLLYAGLDQIRVQDRRLFDLYPYPFFLLNSVSAVAIGYFSFVGLRKFRVRRVAKARN